MRLSIQTTLAAFATVAASAAFAPAHANVVFLNPTKKDGLPTSTPVPTFARMAPSADDARSQGPGAADFPSASEADLPAGDDRRDADAPPSFADDEAPVLAAILTVTPESGGDGALGYHGDRELPGTPPEPAQRVPEPATLGLAMAALALMTGVKRRRQLERTRR